MGETAHISILSPPLTPPVRTTRSSLSDASPEHHTNHPSNYTTDHHIPPQEFTANPVHFEDSHNAVLSDGGQFLGKASTVPRQHDHSTYREKKNRPWSMYDNPNTSQAPISQGEANLPAANRHVNMPMTIQRKAGRQEVYPPHGDTISATAAAPFPQMNEAGAVRPPHVVQDQHHYGAVKMQGAIPCIPVRTDFTPAANQGGDDQMNRSKFSIPLVARLKK